jgi:hypothetical protein
MWIGRAKLLKRGANMKKRILSLVLALSLILALVPFSIPAAVATGHGSNGKFLMPIAAPAAGSIPISNRAELEAIRHNLSGSYHLTANIDLFGTEWVPLGDRDNAFTGVFDGQGYVVRNLTLMNALRSYRFSGLFGRASDSTIKNVGMEDVSIGGSGATREYSGGIVGHNSGIVINCYSSGSIHAGVVWDNAYAGGIVGFNATSGSVNNCYSTSSVSVHGSPTYAGGISGYNAGSINDCHNTGLVSGYALGSFHAGGISGYNAGSIRNSYNTGTINTTSGANNIYMGGICGYNAVSSSISQSYNTGSLSMSHNANNAYSGGICGYNAGTVMNNYNTGSASSSSGSGNSYSGGISGYNAVGASITTNYNSGAVSTSSDRDNRCFLGGVCGQNEGTVTNSIWNVDSGQTLRGDSLPNVAKKGIGSGTDTTTSLSTAQMQQQSSFDCMGLQSWNE